MESVKSKISELKAQAEKIAVIKEQAAKLNPSSYKSNVFVAGPYMINGVYVGAFLASATAVLISWTIRIITNKGFLPALKHWKFWLFNLIAIIAMFLANIQLDAWHGFNTSWIYRRIEFA